MRWGDYIVVLSLTLNSTACLAYLAQGHKIPALYWLGAACINVAVLVGLK